VSAKSWIRINLNRALEPLGLQVNRFWPETTSRRMLSPSLQTRQLQCLSQEFSAVLADFPGLCFGNIEDHEFATFLDKLSACPVKQQTGGSGVNAALNLWLLARMIQPSLIVESGVLRGFTSWVLERAAHDAEIHSFDISFADLRFRSKGIHYHECDWAAVDIAASDPARSLAFFDDHVDQWRRVREAAGRGFRYLVFDDNVPANALHGDGNAAFPTLDMLFDDDLTDGELLEWRTECGRFSYRYDRSMALATRQLVRHFVRLPSLHLSTGYSPANLTLVETAVDPLGASGTPL
jgi:hypothetical protein